MTDFELDPNERDDDFPYDYAYIHEETGRLWPVVLGVTLLILLAAGYVWEDRYTRPPKVETAPKYAWAQLATLNLPPFQVRWVQWEYKCRIGETCRPKRVKLDRFGESCDKHVWSEAKSEEWAQARYEDCGGHSMATGAGPDAREIPFSEDER